MVPAAIKAYETLGVKHEPLTLIPPHFEAPLPPTQASVKILRREQFNLRNPFENNHSHC